MSSMIKKSFNAPEEIRHFDKGKVEVVYLGDLEVIRVLRITSNFRSNGDRFEGRARLRQAVTEDWSDKHRLGYGVVTTLASLQHWASRLKIVTSVAKCLHRNRLLTW
jgi:hypothetical protein